MVKSNATIRDVAEVAGVSLGTVSRVLNGGKHVTFETQQRVLAAMRGLDYQPNAVAQSMRTKATRTIGFIIIDVANHVFGSFVKAAQELLHEASYSLVLVNTGGSSALEGELVTVLQQRQVYGVIMTVADENNPDRLNALHRLQLPIVLLDRELPVSFDMVLTDYARGMYQATRYLLELGHREIALIMAGQSIRAGRERLRGFEESY